VYTQIIVPFDGGEFSAGAINVGRRLAELMNAPMRIIAFASNKSSADALTAVVQRELDSLTDIQVAWSVRITGNAVDALAAEWSKYPGALVCMRSVGRSRMAPVLGSFAEGVLYNMYGPVLLVGPHARTDEFRPEGAMVVCSDGSDTAEKILPIAAQWAITLPLEPWIVNVSDPAGRWIDAELRGDLATDVTLAGHVAREFEEQIGRAVQHEALHSAHPARAIAAFAEDQKATLIAMSTHGASGIRRVALGSVTMAVVHCAPCPVLVYRPPHVPKH
jgi:nucleotide-binding universal stress UspA family protein